MAKDTKEQLAVKASLTNRLEFILNDYFSFRVQITFKNDKKVTLYGHEHSCTYQQCLHQHVPHIVLNKLKGYTALLDYIHGKRAQIKKAVLYMRTLGAASFDTLCRRYYNGVPDEEINDPVLTGQEQTILQYQIINGRVVIKSADVTLPDFKAEIQNHFLTK